MRERKIMHNFLRTVGFEKLDQLSLDAMLNQVIHQPDFKHKAIDSQGNDFYEFSKYFGNRIGITVCGNYIQNDRFKMDYYYPYFCGSGVTSDEYIELERHSDKESYAAICDDIKIGTTLIFFVQNVAEYLRKKSGWKQDYSPKMSVTLSALSLSGKILLPINKSETQIQKNEKVTQNRNHLIAAAREGDEDAIESLTLEDIDIYSMLSKRIVNEDLLSIVDSYFMPFGVESDHYSVMGDILDINYVDNAVTAQKLCILTVDTNDLVYDICINQADLFGEPMVGRRFKGRIWMQGSLNIKN